MEIEDGKKGSENRERANFMERFATNEDNIREIMDGLRSKKERYFVDSTLGIQGQTEECLIVAVELGLIDYDKARNILRGVIDEDEQAEKRVEQLKNEVIEKIK